jgi:leader peptidase (prepilin peptidase)/N-methyltransferase
MHGGLAQILEWLSQPDNGALSLTAGALGLLIGSFLNVVIYRLPRMMQRATDNFIAQESGQELPHPQRYNLLLPRSCCPRCEQAVKPQHNIPVLSYLLLRGRCGQCRQPISLTYPLVETFSALLSALLVWRFGAGVEGVAALLFAYFLLSMSIIDAQTQLLPDDLSLPLMWLGLLVNLGHTFAPLQDAVIGAAAGYGMLWLIFWAFKLATGKDGLGYGDFKLLAALGAWLGWQALPFILLMASALGAVVGIALVVFRKQARDQPIPFGPYLAIAGMLALLHGKDWLTGIFYAY